MLTLDRDYRSVVVPNNDFFLELDFNGAELRCLLGLSGLEQPKDDIHAWNVKNVYKDSVTREEAKKRIFAWLYNLESKDLMSNRAYDRDSLLEKYFDGEHIHNPFGRKIKCDKFHAINFLIQRIFCKTMDPTTVNRNFLCSFQAICTVYLYWCCVGKNTF